MSEQMAAAAVRELPGPTSDRWGDVRVLAALAGVTPDEMRQHLQDEADRHHRTCETTWREAANRGGPWGWPDEQTGGR